MNLHDSSPSTHLDMFPSLPLTPQQVTAYCQQRWVWKFTSNIIFSNGNLDPWAEGGILKDLSDSVVAFNIHGGAHHLDLRLSDKNDPPSVREVRDEERRLIQHWIQTAEL
ncbi:unnamed protein product [Echinostoma caproni]|uniref:Peptidase S10, serine carboxypeptidase, Alpha/Beta hydrolase fold protein n=1 Tax=Echinostoma caproni TaxID=27848 RepID=A0A183AD64_9TREM|nr:unnamed protein product [Echinostoma caproni]